MSQKPHHLNVHSPAGHPQRITDADEAHSADMRARTIKYTISMSVRLVCFIAAFFVHGWLQVALLVLAVVLPYFAVVVANAGGADLAKRSEGNYYDAGTPAALSGPPAQDSPPRTPGGDAPDDSGGSASDTGGGDGDQPDVFPGEWYSPEEPAAGAEDHHGHQGKERHRG